MKLISFGLLFMGMGWLSACSKGDKAAKPEPVLAITAFPQQAKGGEVITISGSGFSSTKEENSVTINNIPAQVKEATNTTLKVAVPMKAGDGKISIKVGAETVTSANDMVYDWVWSVSDLAGETIAGAVFGSPSDIALAPDGNILYVTDMSSHKIWKILLHTDGTASASVLAGDGNAGANDGTGTAANFNLPMRLATDKNGNIYVADYAYGRIRKITPAGVVSTLKNTSTDMVVSVREVEGIALDPDGNIFTGIASGKISKISPVGVVSDYVVRNGENYFISPTGISLTRNGDLIVACFGSHTIAKVTKNTEGSVQLVPIAGTAGKSGRGDGTPGLFNNPYDVVPDHLGNMYVADYSNYCIRKLSPVAGGGYTVSTIAGSLNGESGYANGIGTAARFNDPVAVEVSADGNTLYVADRNNLKIRKMVRQ